jgi:hypothetical protein
MPSFRALGKTRLRALGVFLEASKGARRRHPSTLRPMHVLLGPAADIVAATRARRPDDHA